MEESTEKVLLVIVALIFFGAMAYMFTVGPFGFDFWDAQQVHQHESVYGVN